MLQILLNLFIPLVIVFIKFNSGDRHPEYKKKAKSQENAEGMALLNKRASLFTEHLQDDGDTGVDDFQHFYRVSLCKRKGRHTIKLWHAIYCYLTAPVVKFCYHSVIITFPGRLYISRNSLSQ